MIKEESITGELPSGIDMHCERNTLQEHHRLWLIDATETVYFTHPPGTVFSNRRMSLKEARGDG